MDHIKAIIIKMMVKCLHFLWSVNILHTFWECTVIVPGVVHVPVTQTNYFLIDQAVWKLQLGFALRSRILFRQSHYSGTCENCQEKGDVYCKECENTYCKMCSTVRHRHLNRSTHNITGINRILRKVAVFSEAYSSQTIGKFFLY